MGDDEQALTVLLVFVFATPISIAMVWAAVRILQKAGYSGWNILWYFVPFVGIVMFFIFAFSEWPIQKRFRVLEAQVFGPDPCAASDRRT